MEHKEIIQIIIDEFNLLQKDFAAKLNIKPKTLTNIAFGTQKISPELALQISETETPNKRYFNFKWILTGTGDPFIEYDPEIIKLAKAIKLNPGIMDKIMDACYEKPELMSFAATSIYGNYESFKCFCAALREMHNFQVFFEKP